MSTIQGAGDPSDRRDNQRFEVEVVVRIYRGDTTLDWPSEDISAGGMRLRVDGDPPKIGERLKVSFKLPLLAAPIATPIGPPRSPLTTSEPNSRTASGIRSPVAAR
ncbi:MAG: PilZ domain-containing protein [Rhodospirillales bacterium]|nr:PilZ domain-containing protein [Rhodospirillales bacterium]